jgi:hypothetical protein
VANEVIMDQSSTGLMAFWSDIDEDYIERYRDWHTTEHIPERVGIPGFVRGQRYSRIHNGRAFFMYYDTASVAVLRSPAYLAALNAPTPWTLESLKHFKNPLRNLYQKVAERGGTPPTAVEYCTCVRFNRSAEVGERDLEREFELLSGGEWVRTRYLEIDQAATATKTKERDVYGAQLQSQRFLYLVERKTEQAIPDSDALKGEFSDLGMVDIEVEVYRLDFGMLSSL